ncbi:MAG: hypothetical protein IKM31_10495 [Oscillospiraceae bacterium]|nr:hypothetical protein [Oscillospiraceae bacterium]
MNEQESQSSERREKERRPVLPLIILIAGIIGILSLAVGAYLLLEGDEEIQEETASFCLQLGVWEDRLAVFTSDDHQPSQVLDIPLAALPEADRRLLLEQISLRDEEELRRMIEDFT